jgi:uncharacterized protein YlxW (UPF0749 family)
LKLPTRIIEHIPKEVKIIIFIGLLLIGLLLATFFTQNSIVFFAFLISLTILIIIAFLIYKILLRKSTDFSQSSRMFIIFLILLMLQINFAHGQVQIQTPKLISGIDTTQIDNIEASINSNIDVKFNELSTQINTCNEKLESLKAEKVDALDFILPAIAVNIITMLITILVIRNK